jgi:hypothetical protein
LLLSPLFTYDLDIVQTAFRLISAVHVNVVIPRPQAYQPALVRPFRLSVLDLTICGTSWYCFMAHVTLCTSCNLIIQMHQRLPMRSCFETRWNGKIAVGHSQSHFELLLRPQHFDMSISFRATRHANGPPNNPVSTPLHITIARARPMQSSGMHFGRLVQQTSQVVRCPR